MSPRTAEYVAAMVREGDNFDYNEWLKEVRQEEAQAKRAEATGALGELGAGVIDKPNSTPDGQHVRPNAASRWIPKTHVLRARWPHRQAKSQTRKARLRRWLKKVRLSWDDFQASRARDAVYGYLESVFAIVEHYKVRRRTKRLLRHAFDLADLPFDKNADPLSAVIRCTCGNVDTKLVSKWSRALRCVQYCKKPRTPVKKFMKASGGINACAAGYAKLMRRE
jgi:hypothetical protein